MQLSRLRFTMRWMMIAVAIVGVLMGLEVMRQRVRSFREKAAFHLAEQTSALHDIDFLKEEDQRSRDRLNFMVLTMDETTLPMDVRKQIEKHRNDPNELRRWAEWHGLLAKKYSFAATHPWFVVATDSPALPKPRYVQEREDFDNEFDKLIRNSRTPLPSTSKSSLP